MAGRFDIRDEIANRFIAALDEGKLPWTRPWTGGGANRPHNPATGTRYRGSNLMLLSLVQHLNSYTSTAWVTLKGAGTLGGRIRKGEKGTAVLFWKFIRKEDQTTGGVSSFPLAQYYTVFNADQTEGLSLPAAAPVVEVTPIAAAEAIITGMRNAPTIREVDGDSAHYTPATDTVTLPLRGRFRTPAGFYATAFHELVHSTGHASRLKRDLSGAFGSGSYTQEELVAEIGAAFLAAEAGILPEVQDNSLAYAQGWSRALKDRPRAILDAASAAQKAVDCITGVEWKTPDA